MNLDSRQERGLAQVVAATGKPTGCDEKAVVWSELTTGHLRLHLQTVQLQGQRVSETRLATFFRSVCAVHIISSDTVSFRHKLIEPTQGKLHLSSGASSTSSMEVQWVSGLDSSASKATVVWGLHSNNYTNTSTSSKSTTYLASDMCVAPANIDGPLTWIHPGYFHSVLLDKLPPNTKIFYRYGQEGHWSEEAYFLSPLDPSRVPEEWSFIAYGDQGNPGILKSRWPSMTRFVNYGYASATEQVLHAIHSMQEASDSEEPRLLVHFGDLTYARSSGMAWELWQNAISTIARRMPYMVSVGNVDYGTADDVSDQIAVHNDPSNQNASLSFHPLWGNYHSDGAYGECGVPMFHRFPKPPPGGNGIFWYSFDHGNVHFVVMSSEHDFEKGSYQHDWLARDLASVHRATTPWVILALHRPIYCSQWSPSDKKIEEHLQQALDELLLKYHVNAVVAGHYHSYERTCAVTAGKCQIDGRAPVHFMAGTAGKSLDNSPYQPNVTWSRKRHVSLGFLSFIVSGNAHLRVQFHVPSKDGSTEVVDETTLFQY